MPVYTYKARDFRGNLIKGELELDSEIDIRHYLVKKQLIPIEIKEKTAWNTDLEQLPIFKPKVKIKDIAIFCRQFAVMIESGISIGGALDILRKQIQNRSLKEIIQKVYEEVQKGRSLSEAMKEYKEFPSILINMIEAGEVSGNLDFSMKQMAEHFEKQVKIQSQVKKAMTYPVIVMTLMVAVVIGLIVFVVPRYISMFQDAEAQLPGITLALIDISNFIKEKWYILIGIIILLIFGFKYANQNKNIKYVFDKYALNMPIFGNVNRKIIAANFSQTLNILLKAGIPIIQTMEVVKKVVQNLIAQEIIDDCINEIKQGGSLAVALQQRGLFPLMMISMIRIGEESGALDSMMEKAAQFYQDEVEVAIDQMTTMISPIITLIMGAAVGFIMLAIMMPMFSLATQI
ncbi:type II secretion system F family protein [Defluviitalea phaphyphila]|uniref:type II secretion system F family protein n=1 Tax=Defluviitalea phaphyphila TaxID=1473580 RepID=UPI000730BDF9|nr:type II secretion system F family protein [Defluviitalea phaphyphila]